MFKVLNNQDKFGYPIKNKSAKQVGLMKNLTNFNCNAYFCGNLYPIENNQHMKNIWNKKDQTKSQFNFKYCYCHQYNDYITCYLITENGDLYTSGYNDENQMGMLSSWQDQNGIDHEIDTTTFQKVDKYENKKWKKISSVYNEGFIWYYQFVNFLTQDGQLYCSGYEYDSNSTKQCLTKASEIIISDGTVLLQDGILVEDICGFQRGNLMIDKDGYIYTRGNNNTYGVLGNGTNRGICRYFKKISSQNNWAKIASGAYSCYALKSNGELYGWGDNRYGQLGLDDDSTTILEPTRIGNDILFKNVSAGRYHMICQDIEGNRYVTGRNNCGQLGVLSENNDKNPNLIKIFPKFNARGIYARENSTAIVDVQGGCYCVGYSNNTILNGYTGNVLQWAKVGYINDIRLISMTQKTFCFISGE